MGEEGRRALALQDLKAIINPTISGFFCLFVYSDHTLKLNNTSDKMLLAQVGFSYHCYSLSPILVYHWPGAQQERTEELL